MKHSITIGVYGIQDVTDSGIPTISHDHGLAVMEHGKTIHYVHLERIDRLKHSNQMPFAIYNLLKEKKLLGIKSNLVFVDNMLGRAFINKHGNIRFEAYWPEYLKPGTEDGYCWWLDKMREARVLNHEMAHLGSCLPFFGNFKPNSLLIHFDGGASRSNFSAWFYDDIKISCIEHHWNLKEVSSFYNANALIFGILGAKMWEMNSVPGKLMGFASYGKYRPELEIWLNQNQFFENIWQNKNEFIKKVKEEFGIEISRLNTTDKFLQDIAATLQEIFIRELLKQINHLKKQTKADNIYYSGGSALNIVANTRIIETCGFNNVFIPPCCNDSGLALGAAAFHEWEQGNKIEIQSPYLNNWGIENYSVKYDDDTLTKVCDLLLHQKVIGICNAYGEAGPRALGNRSIIGLASDKKLAQKISEIHKGREWYRPVAPVMLKRNVAYFCGNTEIHPLSSFMLVDFNVEHSKAAELAGAVHVDGTARIQTIFEREDNPFMYDLLMKLDLEYSIKALINTSFNRKGEPIVHTVDDALKSAMAMQLDAVILNGELRVLNL